MSQIGTLSVGILGDMAGLTKALDGAKKGVEQFAAKTKELGTQVSNTGKTLSLYVSGPIIAATTAITALTVNVGKFADNLLTQSAQTGISTKSLQEWRYIATLCGTSADAVVSAIYGLSRRMAELENDTGEGAEALQKLGLTFDDIKGKSPEAAFNLLLERLSTIPDVLERNSVASKTLGLGWKEIAPIIAAGGDEINRLREEANELGVVIGDEGIKAAADFDNAWDSVTEQIKAAKNQLGIEFAPLIQNTVVPLIQNTVIPAIRAFAEKIKEVVEWFQELSPEARRHVMIVVGLLAASGPLLIAIGGVITAIGKITTAVNLLFGAVTTFLGMPIVAGLAVFIGAFALFQQSIGDTDKQLEDLGYHLDKFNDKTSELERHWHDLIAMSWGDLVADLKAAADQAGIAADQYGLLVEKIDEAYRQVIQAENLEQAEGLWKGLITGIIEEIGKLDPAMQAFVDAQLQRLETTAEVTRQILQKTEDAATETSEAVAGTVDDVSVATGEANKALLDYYTKVDYHSRLLRMLTSEQWAQMLKDANDFAIELQSLADILTISLVDLTNEFALQYIELQKFTAGTDQYAEAYKDLAAIVNKARAEQELFFATTGQEQPTLARMISLFDGITFAEDKTTAGTNTIRQALDDLSKQAKVTAEEFLTTLAGNMTSAITTFGEGLLTMSETNQQLADEHASTLEKINTDFEEAASAASKAREKDLQDLKDKLADGKITQAQYARDSSQVWGEYTDTMKQYEKEREGALDDEQKAYEEQKVTIGKLVGDLVHTVLTGIARTLLGYAAEHAALAIINALLLNPVQAAKEAAAAAAAGVAAAGMATFESAIPFDKGGMVAGALGEPVPAIVHGGEAVFTPDQLAALGTIDYGLLGEAVHAGVYDAMDELGVVSDRPMILQVDGKTFGRIALPLVQREKVRLGLEAV
ncbi:MAG: hypothetical protein WC565_06375 [Parcubacteria group bacterium]|jgi:hypothetical protein